MTENISTAESPAKLVESSGFPTSIDKKYYVVIRKRLKRILIILGATIVLITLFYFTIFWSAKYWFSENYKFGKYNLHTNSTFNNSSEYLDKIDHRLKACALNDEKLEHSIHTFSSESKFQFYAIMAGSSYPTQGFNMHAFNKIYISTPFIGQVYSERKAANKIVLHSAMEGNMEEIICHEIIHSFVYNKLGSIKASSLPTWKQGGYAEYGANILPKRNDATYRFKDRVALYKNSSFWDGNKFDFEYYEAEILVLV